MSKVNKIKKLIEPSHIPGYITNGRAAIDAVEAAWSSDKPEDDRLLAVWDACVKHGLYSPSEL